MCERSAPHNFTKCWGKIMRNLICEIENQLSWQLTICLSAGNSWILYTSICLPEEDGRLWHVRFVACRLLSKGFIELHIHACNISIHWWKMRQDSKKGQPGGGERSFRKKSLLYLCFDILDNLLWLGVISLLKNNGWAITLEHNEWGLKWNKGFLKVRQIIMN